MSVAIAVAIVVLASTHAATWILAVAVAALMLSVARSLWLER